MITQKTIRITPQNYNSTSKFIPFAKLPKDLADTHAEMPLYLEFYGQDKEITSVVDLYLQKVNKFIQTPVTKNNQKKQPPRIYTPPTANDSNISSGGGEAPVNGIEVIAETVVPKPPCGCNKNKGIVQKLKNPLVLVAIAVGILIGKNI